MSLPGIVHVIDGDETAREGAAVVLRAAGYATRTYDSASRFLDDMLDEPRGCIVVELHLPDMGGLDLLGLLQGRDRTLPLVVMSAKATVRSAVMALRAGAVDVLEKPVGREDLLAAVGLALKRWHEHRPEAGEVELRARLGSLSARERQVLDLLIAGRPNKIIAFDLGISVRTIELYRSHVMNKMKASSLSELVRMAIAAGAAPPPRKAVG